jgi:hypothetical protein
VEWLFRSREGTGTASNWRSGRRTYSRSDIVAVQEQGRKRNCI